LLDAADTLFCLRSPKRERTTIEGESPASSPSLTRVTADFDNQSTTDVE
jgi:hypothetical protein